MRDHGTRCHKHNSLSGAAIGQGILSGLCRLVLRHVFCRSANPNLALLYFLKCRMSSYTGALHAFFASNCSKSKLLLVRRRDLVYLQTDEDEHIPACHVKAARQALRKFGERINESGCHANCEVDFRSCLRLRQQSSTAMEMRRIPRCLM